MNDGHLFQPDLAPPPEEGVRLVNESANWRTRDVRYFSGLWPQVRALIPRFELGEFRSDGGGPPNPFYRAVYRLPMTPFEQRMPVGIVSNTYTLAQHQEVAQRCVNALADCGYDVDRLECQLGLSTLGEWMNFRMYLPEGKDYVPPDKHRLRLRFECFNAVDGGASLELFLGWHRLVCSNGLVINKSLRQLRAIHDASLDIAVLSKLVPEALNEVAADREQLHRWSTTAVKQQHLSRWVDTAVADTWGKLAAFRTLHICRTGHDAEFLDSFEKARPSEKRSAMLEPVPGAARHVVNLYDVSQALSWVATHRRNADERSGWQRDIPALIAKLEAA